MDRSLNRLAAVGALAAAIGLVVTLWGLYSARAEIEVLEATLKWEKERHAMCSIARDAEEDRAIKCASDLRGKTARVDALTREKDKRRPADPMAGLSKQIDGLEKDVKRLPCLIEGMEYRAKLENMADLPHGWLADNVFGKRDKPNLAALDRLSKPKLRKLLHAMETEPRPPSCDG